MANTNAFYGLLFIIVCLEMTTTLGAPASRLQRHSGETRHSLDNEVERTSIRLIRALMSMETNQAVRQEMLHFLKKLKRVRSRRNSDIEFTHKYSVSIARRNAKKFMESISPDEDKSQEKLDCYAGVVKHKNNPKKFLEELLKCG